jgi:hypothetical protein
MRPTLRALLAAVPLAACAAFAQSPDIILSTTTERTSFMQGETARFTIRAENQTDRPLRFTMPSGQTFDLRAFNDRSGAIAWTWSMDKFFTQALRQIEIGPRQSLTETMEWPIGDTRPGDYWMYPTLPWSERGDLTYEQRPARVTVTARQGAPQASWYHIEGTVTSVTRLPNGLLELAVDGEKTAATQYDRARVTVSTTATVVRQQGTQEVQGTISELERGQRVRISFVGPVRLSYPVQADAGRILILRSNGR